MQTGAGAGSHASGGTALPPSAMKGGKGAGEDSDSDMEKGLSSGLNLLKMMNKETSGPAVGQQPVSKQAKAAAKKRAVAKSQPHAASAAVPKGEDAAPDAQVFAEIKEGVKKVTRKSTTPAVTSTSSAKRGRINAQELAALDGQFVEEIQTSLNEIVNEKENPIPTTCDADLVGWAKISSVRCQDVVSKISQKVNQIKRRKNKTDDGDFSDKLKEFNQTAMAFLNLFSELALAAPKAATLESVMSQVSSLGYDCGRVATMKLLKATVFDLVKYNRYTKIACAAVEVSHQLSGSEEDSDFFMNNFALIVEQVMQKLLRTLPQSTSQLKLCSPNVQNIKAFLTAIVTDDGLTLQTELHAQVKTLLAVFTVDDKTILPTDVIEAVTAINNAKNNQKLFLVMKSLPQGTILTGETKSFAEKRMTSDKTLSQLAALTTEVSETLRDEHGQVDIAKVSAAWPKLVAMVDDLKDKPEYSNLIALQTKMETISVEALKMHAQTELADFIAAQKVQSFNKMKCVPFPQWSILQLRNFMPNEDLFRLAIWELCVLSFWEIDLGPTVNTLC